MWIADIYCDLDWVRERQGRLGPRRVALKGMRSQSLAIDIEIHLYGNEHSLHHVRVLMHTDDAHVAQACVDLNIQTWVTSVEAAMIMHTGHPFTIAHPFGALLFPVTVGAGDADSPAVFMEPKRQDPAAINYPALAHGIAAWPLELQHHLFYFRRLIDERFPLDVRWLNGYRLLEWHFCGIKGDLPKSPQWKAFLERFKDDLRPHQRSKQTAVGLIEEARALAAHAGLDDRPEEARARDPRTSIEKTFPVLERMVMTVLNEHPARKGNPVQFRTREQGC